MDKKEIVEGLRAEIAHLQKVVDLLSDQPQEPQARKAPGRPRKVVEGSAGPRPVTSISAVRQMSAEGKARIAAAQRKRWADQKTAGAAVKVQEGTSAASRRLTSVKTANKSALPKAAVPKSAKAVGRPRKASGTPGAASKKSSTKTRAKKSEAAA